MTAGPWHPTALALLTLAALGVTACGSSNKATPPTSTAATSTSTTAAATTTTIAATTTSAPPITNSIVPVRNPDGTMPIAAFNTWLATAHPTVAQDPARIAGEFLQLADSEAASVDVSTSRISAQRTDVVVTESALPDDSVHAIRSNLRLALQPDQTWRLVTATWSQQCQPNRGHQNFTTAVCI
jgi:hypothetical protein